MRTRSPLGEYTLVGEPFVRDDGKEVAIYNLGKNLVVLSLDNSAFFYARDTIVAAGAGDEQQGFVQLGQAANHATAENTDNFSARPHITPIDSHS